jgi:prophage maintenance system killer protein
VVQIRIWVQDAYTGSVIWTNRNDVKISPSSFWADYQYDTLFEVATEKAVATLMNDFAYTVYNVPLPVEKKTRR